MSGVPFPYKALDGAVLELEPDATDTDVVQTIATLVEIHLHGSTPEQVSDFWRASFLPLAAGLMVGTMGEKLATEAWAAMPRFTQEANLLDSAVQTGPAN